MRLMISCFSIYREQSHYNTLQILITVVIMYGYLLLFVIQIDKIEFAFIDLTVNRMLAQKVHFRNPFLTSKEILQSLEILAHCFENTPKFLLKAPMVRISYSNFDCTEFCLKTNSIDKFCMKVL